MVIDKRDFPLRGVHIKKNMILQTWTTGESELHQILTDRAVQKVEQAEPEGVL